MMFYGNGLIFFLFLYAFFGVNSAQQFNQRDRFCCCLNISEACCAIENFDVQVDQTLRTGNDPTYIRTVYYGNYSRAHIDSNYIKNNFNLFSSGQELDCEATRVLLLPTRDGFIVPLADITLQQITPTLCLANFSNLVYAERLREDVDLAIGFQGIVPSYEDIDVQIALREKIVGYTLPQHSTVVTADPQDSTKIDISLSVQIGANSIHNETCFAQENLDQLAFQLGDPLQAKPECLFPATSISDISPRGSVLIETLGITQAQYLNQCSDSVEFRDGSVVYTFQVSESFGTSCGYIEEYPDEYPSYFFTITIASTISANNQEQLANTIQLDYRQDTLELIPCASDDEGFDQSVSSLIPMGRLRFTLDILTAYQFVPVAVGLPTLNIQDIELRVVSGPTFLPQRVNESDVTQYVLETAECLWVVTQHSEQPATQENLIGCTVDYLSQMSITANVTFADAFVQDNVLLGDERSIVYQSNNASDCPVQAATTDVTSTYNAQLIVQDRFGASDSLNLDQEIVIRVGLDSQLMQAFDGLTVVMDQIIINLVSDELTAEDGEFVRMFSTVDKISQMQLDFHPYYRDGHFCRSYTPAPSNLTSATCQRFYSDGARGQWNPFMAEQLGTSFFQEDLDGQPRYSFCQDRTELKEDRFIFTPSNWIFSQFPYSTGTMQITATAFVRQCTTVADDFTTRRRFLRRLQESGGTDGTGSTIIFQNVTFINSDVNVAGGDLVVNEMDALYRDIIIGLSIAMGVIILACCSCGALILYRNPGLLRSARVGQR